MGMSQATVATFSGSNLNAAAGDKTVGSITLSTSTMTYNSGLYASSSNKSFTLTASSATISQVVITTNSTNTRYTSANITSCTSCTRNDKVYTCTISPAVATVSCTNSGGGVTITQIVVTYAATVAASNPTITIAQGAQNGNTPLTISSDNASKIYYYWDGTSTAEAKGHAAYGTGATGSSVNTAVENVAGLRYLHAYGYNATGTSDIVTFTFDVTKVKDAAGLAYETSSVSKETGASAFTNTLTNPHSLSVTYSITNNGTGSTINASTGEVTPGSIVGTETITATSEATADYLAGETTYTLTIYSFNGTSIIKVDLTAGSSSASVDVSGTIGGTADVKVQKDTKFGSGHYVGFTLADSKQFKTGDILNVKVTTASENGSIIVYDKKTGADGQTILYNTGVKGVVGENKFVLPSEINNLSTIYICRTTENAWNGFVDYIEVFRPLPSVELNESGYATFYGYANFTVSGATAYKAKLNAGGDALELTSLSGIIPANSAVILVGSADATVTLSYTNETATADMTNNILEGTAVRTTTASLKTKANFYAFDKTDNKFKIYNGTNFPANKAFFQTGGSLAPSAIRIEFEENGATDIKSVEEKETAVKFFDGGRILIMKNGVVYDALGRVIR